eukprot:TRINITY_DN2648_c0_g1_i10.p2 TRINITY_DN2648_c0_g1~~TRINITY_DN2648_c0_g1_i10.p2  ORF type:complete len:213 (-),score=-21.68 TRINITY_DN2648_c0_g1_i10:1344-1982(-)
MYIIFCILYMFSLFFSLVTDFWRIHLNNQNYYILCTQYDYYFQFYVGVEVKICISWLVIFIHVPPVCQVFQSVLWGKQQFQFYAKKSCNYSMCILLLWFVFQGQVLFFRNIVLHKKNQYFFVSHLIVCNTTYYVLVNIHLQFLLTQLVLMSILQINFYIFLICIYVDNICVFGRYLYVMFMKMIKKLLFMIYDHTKAYCRIMIEINLTYALK